MKTRSEIRRELKALAAKAEAEGREFTPAERQQVETLIADMKSAANRSEDRGTDAELRKAMDDLLGPVGFGHAEGAASPVPGRIKATGGTGRWGETWAKAHAGKALLTPGTIPVTVPLASEPVDLGSPVLALRQVIPTVGNDSGHFSYLRQTVRTNNARTVAAGSRKPESTYTLERVDGRPRTIAHLSEPIHRNDLADAEQLRDFMESEMRLGFELALEDEIINGDGTALNGEDRMTGLLATSGIQSQAWDTDRFVTARRAVAKLENVSLTPTAWVMTPDEWLEFELATTTDGAFRLDPNGDRLPIDRAARRLWGVPVVLSVSGPTGAAVLLDGSSVRLHLREEGNMTLSENVVIEDPTTPGVYISTFTTNQVQLRFEGRADLEVSRPLGIVEADLTAV